MSNDAVDGLRAQLAGLTGTARTRPLLELARALANRYWRAGPGTATGLPDLDGAVEALEEAYGYLHADDTLRAEMASQLSWLLGARYLAHGGPDRDRTSGIRLSEEALASPQLPPALRTMVRIVLGQLYVSGLTRRFQSRDFAMEAMRSGVDPADAENANRAVDCFRRILAEPPMSAEITNTAQAMLTVAEAMQTIVSAFGRGPGGLDLGRMMEAMAGLQKLQQQAGSVSAPTGVTLPSMPSMPSLFDAEKMARLDPLDRPVTVVEGPELAESAVPRPPRPKATPVDRAALRRALRDKLATGADLYESIERLLERDGRQPDIGTVDDLVGLAASVVHGGGADGTDHLLLAVALYLRSRIDDGGAWEDDTGGDVQAAADNLLVTAETVPAEQPDAVPAVLRLATLLDERNPSGRVCERLADRFGDVTDSLRTVGADALAYPQADGVLLLEAAGRLRFLTSDQRLPQRILVVGDEPLPLDNAVVSYIASSAQVTKLARLSRMRVTDEPVFVANPRGDRESASVEAMLLRRRFYPWSTGLGRTVENADGSGRPNEVLARLGASMLHLGCGVSTAGALELAGPAELGPKEIAASASADRTAGGVAILPPVRNGFPMLADAFLAAGFVGVVGWLRPVPEPVAALMLFALHAQLVDQRLDSAAAVRAVRQWMRDSARKPLPGLPAAYAATVSAIDLTDPVYWSAPVHRGV